MDGHDELGNPEICCDGDVLVRKKLFYLNHSCDEWIIGGTEQAKQFIAQLQKLVNENPDVEDYRFRVEE